jgi:hypothetical protein
MPTIKQALVKPKNIGEPIPVEAPRAPILPPPIPEREGGMIGFMGAAPANFITSVDSLRQWYRPGVSQSRFPALPTKSNPQLNATIRTIVNQVIAAPKGT